MNRFVRSFAMFVVALAAAGAYAQDEGQYFRLPPTYFYDRASILDDDLEPAVVISTEAGWQRKAHWLAPGIPDDFYLRAFVHKRTGATVFQVVVMQHYYADTWRHYDRATYATPDGPAVAEVKAIGDGKADCSSRLMGCRFIEYVGFTVPEPVLQALADGYKPVDQPGLRFKVKSRSGDEYVAELSAAEISGALARVNEYRLHMKPAADHAQVGK